MRELTSTGVVGRGFGVWPTAVSLGALLLTSVELVLQAWHYDGTPPAQIALMGMLPLVLYFAISSSYLCLPGRRVEPLLGGLARFGARHALPTLLLITVGVYAIDRLTTPRVLFWPGLQGPGYGHDGTHYGAMTDYFAWTGQQAKAPFCYRWLAPLLVHVSGLNIFTGYQALNALSYLVSCVLVYKLARRYGAGPGPALLAVYGFAVLKFGLKLWLYCPIQTDGLGTALLLGVLYAVVTSQHWAYVVLLAAGVLGRENLLVLIPFHLIYHLRRDWRRRNVLVMLALQVIPVGVFLWSRWHPVFEPVGSYSALEALRYRSQDFLVTARRQGVILMGYVNSLGLVLLMAYAGRRHVWTFLRENPEAAYYFGVSVLLSLFGGDDVERFALYLIPLAACVLGYAARTWMSTNPWRWLHWFALHTVSMSLVIPWFPSEAFYLARWAMHAPYEGYRWITWNALSLALAAVLLWWPARPARVE